MQFQKTIERIRHISRSAFASKANESMRLIVTTFIGVLFGFLIGISFPIPSLSKLSLSSGLLTFSENIHIKNSSLPAQAKVLINDTSKIWVPSNPRGAERLPPVLLCLSQICILADCTVNPVSGVNGRVGGNVFILELETGDVELVVRQAVRAGAEVAEVADGACVGKLKDPSQINLINYKLTTDVSKRLAHMKKIWISNYIIAQTSQLHKLAENRENRS